MTKKNVTNSIAHLEEHADYLFSYAMLKLKDVALAEDMVQDTLLSAVAAREGFTAQASVRTWLTTILKNRMIDHWRRQGREIAASDLVGDDGSGDSIDDFFDQAGRWFEMPNAYPSPDEALQSKEFWNIFEQCLSRLKSQQAEVFLAREMYGMSNEEIRESFSLGESNVWVLMHRARVSLGKCLDMNWMK
ncbi:MAG TPA: sigma-70 family RNA polymerase sigma factor [Novimethylophilus sp.]|jgi:RNA polymerase sigma-70 factor (ECF subfamily)|uniref:sigma-70 family RNA polymerase sigma factor n=1 Tax=Novimethylophilus sp. TaxID=2137426 RepID=UPI002F40714A